MQRDGGGYKLWPHFSVYTQKRATGNVLLTEVFKHLGLDESDYFGLQYLDKKEQVVGNVTEEKKPSLWSLNYVTS